MKKLPRFKVDVYIEINDATMEAIKEEVSILRNRLKEGKKNPILYSPDQLRIFRKRKNFLIKLLKNRGVKV